ncbi:hypothetical protein AAW14_01825 [Streptomyces hygroscopicus]|uniref:hypothetical protein n=1 Tax=Streptomyces hygroscopicus TaxID=1912 RepID=UPI00223FF15A|nr:hypothetical protein [Streptomyces hygroscopicus]MCW7940780.1 hypothetical protein [Streptomyces hygroscopicus]
MPRFRKRLDEGSATSAVRYGPGEPFAPVFDRTEQGLTVRTEAFTATIGPPAGDTNGEPALTLHG